MDVSNLKVGKYYAFDPITDDWISKTVLSSYFTYLTPTRHLSLVAALKFIKKSNIRQFRVLETGMDQKYFASIELVSPTGTINTFSYTQVNGVRLEDRRAESLPIRVIVLPNIREDITHAETNKLKSQATRDALESATGKDMSLDTGPLKSVLGFMGISPPKNATIGRARKLRKRKTKRRSNRYRAAS